MQIKRKKLIKKPNLKKAFFCSDERERGRERDQFVVPLVYAFTGSFFYVPRLGMEPTTLAYWGDAPTNRVTLPGPRKLFLGFP